jgi:cob(I)alamin adenosyltransferase
VPRITRVTTRRGDDGLTDLAGGGRIRKDSPRMRAIGAVDELNSAVGLALAFSPQAETALRLREIQNGLFQLGAMLSRSKPPSGKDAPPRISRRQVDEMERDIRSLEERLGPLENFILPGGASCAAALHLARAVCRRAERELVALGRRAATDTVLPVYLNRLSDLLFQLARFENKAAGESESYWEGH